LKIVKYKIKKRSIINRGCSDENSDMKKSAIRVEASVLMWARISVILALLWQNQKALSNIEFGALQKTSRMLVGPN
jgi:hypothetical protein